MKTKTNRLKLRLKKSKDKEMQELKRRISEEHKQKSEQGNEQSAQIFTLLREGNRYEE